jgi:Protein of unknown function (DUF3025)
VEDGLSIAPADAAWIAAQTQLATPYFDAIRGSLNVLSQTAWPSPDALNAIAARQDIRNARGASIRFVGATDSSSAMQYEMQIAEQGGVPTRENFHDLFNALQWLTLPQSKSTMNAAHAQHLHAGADTSVPASGNTRSRERDVLTMFDESGVIVASADTSLLQLIRDFRWRTLFVEHRAKVVNNMRFYLVGHGLMEKALAPFVGLTGKAMLLNINARSDSRELDVAAASWLRETGNLQSSRNLAPLPLLGIPGWDRRNEDAAFYDNTAYFRAGRMRDLARGESAPIAP